MSTKEHFQPWRYTKTLENSPSIFGLCFETGVSGSTECHQLGVEDAKVAFDI